ncbi:hypothetical protein B7494_g76 [Chlorociboria aeruginascens]|nr:hypothetical protein B7494_g76 [Chlorociboria aeruginascens]
MPMPGNNVVSDRFGTVQKRHRRPAETTGHIRIAEAFKVVTQILTILDEIKEAIELRGVWTKDAILWFKEGYPKGDLVQDLKNLHRWLGQALAEFTDAMVDEEERWDYWEEREGRWGRRGQE